MGIPSYFSNIKKKYAREIGNWHLSTLPDNTPCSHLYVDLNGIVHTSAQYVVSMYEKQMQQAHLHLSHTQLQDQIDEQSESIYTKVIEPLLYKCILSELQKLKDKTNPSVLMYIAMDGVAPRAKMEQQRQRRYRSVVDKPMEQDIYNKHKTAYLRGLLWDSNCVTPGTEFMNRLNTFLYEAFQADGWKGCPIVFSGSDKPGEGEHKIMNEIRKTPFEPSHCIVLHGQDADLIMLAICYLATHACVPFYILRDSSEKSTKSKTNTNDMQTTTKTNAAPSQISTAASLPAPGQTYEINSFHSCNIDVLHHQLLQTYLYINELQKLIIRHIESYGDVVPEEEHHRLLLDYVFLCFLLGNDFLPHPPTLSIRDKGIDTLFEVYVPLRKAHNAYLTEHYKDKSTINQGFFTQVIHKLMQQEDYLAGRLHNNVLQKRKWMLQQQRYPKQKNNDNEPNTDEQGINTLKHDLEHMQTLPPSCWTMDDKVLPGTPKWKKRYYTEVEKMSNMHDVHDMCVAYCAGLFWTLQYYIHGCWSTTWYYPYISTPLFVNIEFVLHQPAFRINALVAKCSQFKYNTTGQLLIVLPKESLKTYVYHNSKQKQLAIHSQSYKIVPFSKKFRWECPVHLPRVDEQQILALQKT